MRALTFDRTRERWDDSTGMVLDKVPTPSLAHAVDGSALIRVRYTGFCGTDRGIWSRKSFGDLISRSLDEERSDRRVFGHELLGEVVETRGDTGNISVGDTVSTESHLACQHCYQCQLGQYHVCANEKIIGVSTDGCFAEYISLPSRVLWKTDLDRIRPRNLGA